jgi:hypothetical protein
MTTYILEDDEGTVDAADGVVANSRDDRVRRRLARVFHNGRYIEQRAGERDERGTRREKPIQKLADEVGKPGRHLNLG